MNTTATTTTARTTRTSRTPRRGIRRLVAGLGVCAAAASVVALPVTSGDSPVTDRADAAVRKTVGPAYTLLRRSPASYVLGTAYAGWTVDVHGEGQAGYRWGRVFGTVNSCLWTADSAVTGDAATTDSCGGAQTLPESEFTNGQIGTNAAGNDGVATTIQPGCPGDAGGVIGYGNVSPWAVPAQPANPVATGIGAGATVLWRYVSKDGGFVMVRDPSKGATDGVGIQGWYFVPRGCLPAALPAA